MFAVRLGNEFGEGGGVAKSEVETLRPNRRHHMRGFADQRDARAPEGMRGFDCERKHAAAALDRAAPKSEWARRSIRRISSASPAADHSAARSGSSTQTRLDRRPGSATSVNGPLSVWNSVAAS